MKVLVVGGGGREHALCWAIAASPLLSRLWCAPGNAGIAEVADCVAIDPLDIPGLVGFARDNAVDLVVVGGEPPLVAGLADEFFAGAGARDATRTVFAVGDEKQSIYSFQGADPAAFERMHQAFAERAREAGQPWRAVEMPLSFRSTWTVLRAVDAVFAAGADGVTFHGRPIRHLSNRDGQAGLVEIWPTVKPEPAPDNDPWDAPLDQLPALSPPVLLAERIAGRIDGWLKAGEMLASEGRPIRPGDVMILVRRRERFAEAMIRCLKERGIPVAGSDRMVLTEQLAVMDLMALGRFLLLPEDDLTLAEVLKGPLFGLDDDDLFALAWRRDGTLWEALRRRAGERPVWQAAKDGLGRLLDRADFVPPFEFFSDVLGPGGGRRKILGRLGVDAGDPLDEFLALAQMYERDHVPSLQGFLHWLEAGRTEIKRDLEHGRGEVRVMTVHGAKGLQANVVFLPDTCTVPDPRLDARVLWHEGPPPAALWPAFRANEEATCRALREAARQRQAQEYRRLFYVAMTRARDRLYVCGWETARGRGEDCWYDRIVTALKDRAEAVDVGFEGPGWRVSDPQTAAPTAGRGGSGTADAAHSAGFCGPAPEATRRAAAPSAPRRGAPVSPARRRRGPRFRAPPDPRPAANLRSGTAADRPPPALLAGASTGSLRRRRRPSRRCRWPCWSTPNSATSLGRPAAPRCRWSVPSAAGPSRPRSTVWW